MPWACGLGTPWSPDCPSWACALEACSGDGAVPSSKRSLRPEKPRGVWASSRRWELRPKACVSVTSQKPWAEVKGRGAPALHPGESPALGVTPGICGWRSIPVQLGCWIEERVGVLVSLLLGYSEWSLCLKKIPTPPLHSRGKAPRRDNSRQA